MRILLAPDRFSGTLTAVEAAAALRRGWRRRAPAAELQALGMSDGSAGLLDVVHAARGGRLVPLTVPGPLGGPLLASLLHVPGTAGGTAYVEADQVLGRHLAPAGEERRYAAAGSSEGLGALLVAALGTGASRIVVGLGEAATHDAGAGMLAALGRAATGTDVGGSLSGGGRRLEDLETRDLGWLEDVRRLFSGRDVVLASASRVPLLGLHGAGALLADREGIGSAVAQEIDRSVGHAAHVLERAAAGLAPGRATLGLAGAPGGGGGTGHAGAARHAGTTLGAGRLARADGSGAGGGAALVLRLLGARDLPGAQVVADVLDVRGAVAQTDVVVTGAALLDADALVSSVIATVAEAAMAQGLPVVVLAEEVRTSRREVARVGISATYEIAGAAAGPAGTGLGALEAWAERVARTWSPAT